MIKVSVVMPVYNAARFLDACLETVLNQSLREIEIICVDDGSTDETPELLQRHAGRDSRVRVVRQENSGPAAARNNGFLLAKGEYVIFLDADDWFETDLLEKMVVRADEMCADVCICGAERFNNEDGAPLPSEWMLKSHLAPAEVFSPAEIAEHIFQFTYGQVWDKLYRRSFLKETGITFPLLRNSEDTAFVYNTLLSAGRITLVPEVLVHYRVNISGSVSQTVSRESEAPYEAFRLVEEHLAGLPERSLYEKSFLNWAMEYLVWHVSNMPDGAVRRRYFTQVREYWVPRLGLGSKDASWFEDKGAYAKFRLLNSVPYSVFDVVLRVYKWMKRG